MSKNFKNSIKTFVKSSFKTVYDVDFFSIKPSDRLTLEKQQYYSAEVGKFASWILIGIYVAIFLNFGQNMMYHKNPSSITSDSVSADPPYVDLRQMNFFMAFGFQDLRNKSAHYIDETIYTVDLIHRIKVGTNISLYSYPLNRCSIDMVPNVDDLIAYYSRNQINNLYCLAKDSPFELSLQSTWDGPLYKNILINFAPCINTTKNGNKCKPIDVIQEYLNNGNYAMYFNTLAIDPNNFDKPIVTYGKQFYTPISFATLTYVEMTFNHLNIQTDSGFLFEDIQVVNEANFLAMRQVLSFRSDLVVQIDMKLDKIVKNYIRSYDKIPIVLANIGGIIQSLMILGQLCVLPFVDLNFMLSLANTIFNFKGIKKNSMNKDKQNENSNKKIKELKTQKINPNINNHEKLSISYHKYFFSCFGDETIKMYKKLLSKGLNQIDKVLDISYIMQKLVEIDMLKMIFLDKDQQNLFE